MFLFTQWKVSWIKNNPIDFHRTEEKKIQFEQNFNFWVLFELSLGFKTSCRWLKHANVWSIVQIYMLICMNLSFSYLLMENVSSCMCQSTHYSLTLSSVWVRRRARVCNWAIPQLMLYCNNITLQTKLISDFYYRLCETETCCFRPYDKLHL